MKNLKDKIMEFLRNEKVKKFGKRVFNKKTVITALILLIIVAAVKISFLLMFEINGVVKNIDGKNITVANLISTKTVDVGNYPIEAKQIKIGDKIEITKNLSGDILNIRDRNSDQMNREDGSRDNRKEKDNKNEKNNHREKN
ncbi:hypothetical protein B0P06_000205 [Clostridium saccharoperbutylacetonicum]|uniref:Uncharacterized protein n=1 Tax=Clostridium saccharoperbutylacetonicum N1-4(HMT) TaxID=931276 RepID=M1MW05_9CLOT|nr:hypothetical protein [Clostridium saccharoperbutylacetonicum]AGF55687.1 hypothetical protein Cspa_c19170 [Clostridium saccharoperbutylacetonicum N1-4(HMT)]NRT63587.1 hypothetical protein [Clostridium saccharoperbutylacetonicum]NSB26950.1 hypothetical protein [Clostridium saccharoperbutylacetonicum]NSB40434.1 hypothetical protein [Clostridium saccharoperbutylacetonicum]